MWPWDHDEYRLLLPAQLLALEEGYVDAVDLILTRGPKFVNQVPVVEAAVFSACISIVECLVKRGWDVNGDLGILGHVLGHAIDVRGEYNPDFCCWLIELAADVSRRQGADLSTQLEIACMLMPIQSWRDTCSRRGQHAEATRCCALVRRWATSKCFVFCLAKKEEWISMPNAIHQTSRPHISTEALPCIGLAHWAELTVLSS